MSRLAQVIVAALGVAAILAVGVLVAEGRAQRASLAAERAERQHVEAQLDSAHARERAAAEAAWRAERDALEATAAAARAEAAAERARRQAIPAPLPTVGDSLRYYKATAESQARELALLDSTLAVRDRTIAQQDGVIATLTRQFHAEQAAHAETQVRLARATAIPPPAADACRISLLLTSVRCLSRTESALGAAALALALSSP